MIVEHDKIVVGVVSEDLPPEFVDRLGVAVAVALSLLLPSSFLPLVKSCQRLDDINTVYITHTVRAGLVESLT